MREQKSFILRTSPSTQIRRRLTEGARIISFVRIDNNIFGSRYFRSDLLTNRDWIYLNQSQWRKVMSMSITTKTTQQSGCSKESNRAVDTSLLVLTWLSKSIEEESLDSWELRVADVVDVSSSSKSLTDFTIGSFLWMSRGRGLNESLLIFSPPNAGVSFNSASRP